MIDDMAQLECSNKNATLHLLDIYIYIDMDEGGGSRVLVILMNENKECH